MKAESIWVRNTMSFLHNERHHGITIDLPHAKGGEDKGATALELVIMGVPGCITTIFSMIAKKKELEFDELRCDVESHHEEGISLPYKITGTLDISTNDKELAERVWKQTQNGCPVVKLIRDAGIEVDVKSNFKKSEKLVSQVA